MKVCLLQNDKFRAVCGVKVSVAFFCFQTDPYWTVETLTARDRSRIVNQTVCSLVEMLRLAARANSSALLNIRKPPLEHPRYRSWFMDTLWAVQKAGISQKRVRTVGPFIILLWLPKSAVCSALTLIMNINHKQLAASLYHGNPMFIVIPAIYPT